MRAEAARRAARLARAREEALERVGRELAAAMAAAPPLRHPGGGRLAWAVEAAREAGLGGAVGVAVEGDGCFAVAREVWQAHLLARHVPGRHPHGRARRGGLAPPAAAGPLRRAEAGRLRVGGRLRPLPGPAAAVRRAGRLRPPARPHGPARPRPRRPVAGRRGRRPGPAAGATPWRRSGGARQARRRATPTRAERVPGRPAGRRSCRAGRPRASPTASVSPTRTRTAALTSDSTAGLTGRAPRTTQPDPAINAKIKNPRGVFRDPAATAACGADVLRCLRRPCVPHLFSHESRRCGGRSAA